MSLQKKSLLWLRIVAFVEGCSYLSLAFTMILKYKFAMPLPNKIVGMGHGVLFITYLILVVWVAYLYKWSFVKVGICFLASIIPFGTFWVEKKIFGPAYKQQV